METSFFRQARKYREASMSFEETERDRLKTQLCTGMCGMSKTHGTFFGGI